MSNLKIEEMICQIAERTAYKAVNIYSDDRRRDDYSRGAVDALHAVAALLSPLDVQVAKRFITALDRARGPITEESAI